MTNQKPVQNLTSQWWRRLLILLLICNVLTWIAVAEVSAARGLTVSFFDVGQGDAVLIETASGNQVLIDGGPDPTILEKLGSSMPFYDRTLELVIITHPHQDHIAGVIEVLRRYKVKKILMTGVLYGSQAYRELLRIIEEKAIPVDYAIAGQSVWIDQDALMKVRHPIEPLRAEEVREANESSIVLTLDFGDARFFFTGDAGVKNELEMLRADLLSDVDVLKVGHQGSKTSSSEVFLSAVMPEYAVISVGVGNRYGHPHQEVLDRLSAHDVKLLRTDELGDIVFFSNGGEPYRVPAE